VVPDLGLLRDTFRVVSHRKRIQQLEILILDNPSAGNLEELADLYLEQKKYAKAKECYDRAISSRTDSPDPFYRRSLCELELGDFSSAVADLERVVRMSPTYDYQRAAGLLAYAWSRTGKEEQAAQLFRQVTETSTISETQYNYAVFLAEQGQIDEARQWIQRILNKKATMPRYLKRRERPWFRKAAALLKKLAVVPKTAPAKQEGTD
jgi:tetratricopeptide (TPR) repeat protein